MKKPIVLICWEKIGTLDGLGHMMRIKRIASSLKQRGATCILAVYDANLGKAIASHVDKVILVPGEKTFGSKKFPLDLPRKSERDYFSATTYLWGAGLWNKNYLVRNLKIWDNYLSDIKPDAVVSDFSSHCIFLAAAGRIKTFMIGNGYYVPCELNGYFTPDDKPASVYDRKKQDYIFSIITSAFRQANYTPPQNIAKALNGDVPCPATLPALDPNFKLRSDKLVPPEMDILPPMQKTRGSEILIYLGVDIAAHKVALDAVSATGHPATVYVKKEIKQQFHLPKEIKRQHQPFGLKEIAEKGKILVHHGGPGIIHLAALAGIPQFAIYHILCERWHNARAIWKMGVGGGQSTNAKKDNIIQALNYILRSAQHRKAAISWQEESYKWINGRRGQDVIAERVLSI